MKITVTLFLVGFFHLTIFGQIDLQILATTPNGEQIENVQYEVVGGSVNEPLVTDNIVIPSKSDNFINGVTTLDLVYTTKHILNELTFQEDWQLIAADVNQNQIISTLDIVLMRDVILHVNTSFPNGDSWVFSPSQLEVTDATVFPFEFLGIKLGDVNGTAAPMLTNDVVETRTDGTLQLVTENISLEKGKNYSIPVFAKNYESIAGGQFTFEFDSKNLVFEKIESNERGGLAQNNFGLSNTHSGVILCSWVNGKNENISKDEAFFNINFTANQNGKLSDFISINSDELKAEAYIDNGYQFDFWNIQLGFEDKLTVETISLSPNPFVTEATFSIELIKAGNVTLEIFDASGKMILTQYHSFAKGQNTILVKQSDLSNSGLYFYKIKTGNEIFSGKMILK